MDLNDKQAEAFNKAERKLGYAGFYARQALLEMNAILGDPESPLYLNRKMTSLTEYVRTVSSDVKRAQDQVIAALGAKYKPSTVHTMQQVIDSESTK